MAMPSVSLHHLFAESEAAFGRFWPPQIAQSLSRELLAHRLQVSSAWIASHGSFQVPARTAGSVRTLLKRAAKGEPLAHLIGSAVFYDKVFLVTPSTLIPRPETEQLVDLILARWQKGESKALAIDIGTGSGCIGTLLALKRSPSSVIVTDVSKRALRVAKKNFTTHLGSQATLVRQFQASLLDRHVQKEINKRQPNHLLLAANLPYLPESDRKKLSKSVTAYEPAKALFSGRDGNTLILQFLRQLKEYTNTHPKMRVDAVLECDPPQASFLANYARSLFPNATVHIEKDGFDRERFVCIELSAS